LASIPNLCALLVTCGLPDFVTGHPHLACLLLTRCVCGNITLLIVGGVVLSVVTIVLRACEVDLVYANFVHCLCLCCMNHVDKTLTMLARLQVAAMCDKSKITRQMEKKLNNDAKRMLLNQGTKKLARTTQMHRAAQE